MKKRLVCITMSILLGSTLNAGACEVSGEPIPGGKCVCFKLSTPTGIAVLLGDIILPEPGPILRKRSKARNLPGSMYSGLSASM